MDIQPLITSLRSGDTAPLRMLFEQYGPYCRQLLRQRTGCSREEAHDTFTDALLVFRRNVMEDQVNEVNYPKTYLYTICYYLYRAQRQRQQRASAQQEDALRDLYGPGAEAPAHEQLEQEASRQLLSQRALTAFERLSTRCREVLYYFYVENLSVADIAQRMGINSSDAVKTSRYRCFQRWEEYLNEGPKD